MKTSTKLFSVVGVLLCGVAFAAAFNGPFAGIDTLPRFLKGGAFFGSTATADSLNKLVDTRKGIANWDFPSLNGVGVNCSESATLTMTGVAIGDTCLVSNDFGLDGGLVPTLNMAFSCRSVLNGAVIKACLTSTDAGATNLDDAGYFVRTFR